MNWDAIVAVCEILGASAVVITLVYLARQVKDNATQTKLNTTHTYASLIQDGFAVIYNSADTLRAWTVGSTDPLALDANDQRTFLLFMDRNLNNAIPLAANYKSGAMSRSEFEHYRALYKELVASPGGKFWQQERESTFKTFKSVLKELDAA